MAENETNEVQAEVPVSQPEQSSPGPADAAAPPATSQEGQQRPPEVEAGSGSEHGAPPPSEAPAPPSRREHDRGGGRRGDRRERRPGRRDRTPVGESDGIEETVVKIYRCATVVKGGRRFSFAALVVAGDRQGRVGVGYGKANEVPSAVEKATKDARRNMIAIRLRGTTIPHEVVSKYRASKVKLIPAGEGTGVIAGESVRPVMELAGVKDVLTKVYGSTGAKNLVKAAFEGLRSLRDKEQVSKLRAVSID